MNEQLDLLSWVPPRQTIVFPFAKRVGKVREVVEKLSGKTQRQGGAYWSQMIDGQVRTMERLGLSDAEIDREGECLPRCSAIRTLPSHLCRANLASGRRCRIDRHSQRHRRVRRRGSSPGDRNRLRDIGGRLAMDRSA